MKRTLLAVSGLLLLGYLGLCVLLFQRQRALIYFPQPAAAVAQADTIVLPGAEVRVLVATRHVEGPEALVYFGGNAEQVTHTLPSLGRAFPGHALYLLHYRGYGGSEGAPSEQVLAADALALFDLVHARHPRVVLVGRSLGSGLAVRVASQRPVVRLVLVTPFDSLQEIAADTYPMFPVRWLLTEKYESWRYAPQVNAPTTVIAAASDEVIPAHSTQRLASRFRPGVAVLQTIDGVGHNSISQSPRYLPLLAGDAP